MSHRKVRGPFSGQNSTSHSSSSAQASLNSLKRSPALSYWMLMVRASSTTFCSLPTGSPRPCKRSVSERRRPPGCGTDPAPGAAAEAVAAGGGLTPPRRPFCAQAGALTSDTHSMKTSSPPRVWPTPFPAGVSTPCRKTSRPLGTHSVLKADVANPCSATLQVPPGHAGRGSAPGSPPPPATP